MFLKYSLFPYIDIYTPKSPNIIILMDFVQFFFRFWMIKYDIASEMRSALYYWLVIPSGSS